MIIVIESGALYLVFQLVFLVLFALQHPAQQIVIGMALMIYVSVGKLLFGSELITSSACPGNSAHSDHHTCRFENFVRAHCKGVIVGICIMGFFPEAASQELEHG